MGNLFVCNRLVLNDKQPYARLDLPKRTACQNNNKTRSLWVSFGVVNGFLKIFNLEILVQNNLITNRLSACGLLEPFRIDSRLGRFLLLPICCRMEVPQCCDQFLRSPTVAGRFNSIRCSTVAPNPVPYRGFWRRGQVGLGQQPRQKAGQNVSRTSLCQTGVTRRVYPDDPLVSTHQGLKSFQHRPAPLVALGQRPQCSGTVILNRLHTNVQHAGCLSRMRGNHPGRLGLKRIGR